MEWPLQWPAIARRGILLSYQYQIPRRGIFRVCYYSQVKSSNFIFLMFIYKNNWPFMSNFKTPNRNEGINTQKIKNHGRIYAGFQECRNGGF